MTECNVGILALQGDVTENFMATMAALHDAGIDATVSPVSYTHLTLPTICSV